VTVGPLRNRIRIENRQRILPLDGRRVRGLVGRIMGILVLKGKEISVVLTDDEGIREINRLYLNRDRATNVISFALNEGEFSGLNPEVLGDIVVSVETAARDAASCGAPWEDELAFLLIHGLLHLLGYDHEGKNRAAAARMREEERRVFAALRGYNPPSRT